MTNAGYIQLALTMAILNLVFFCIEFRYCKRIPGAGYLCTISALLSAWAALLMLYYHEPVTEIAVRWYFLRYICIVLLPVFYLQFIISWLNPGRPTSSASLWNLYIVPLAVVITCLHTPFRPYFYRMWEITSTEPMRLMVHSYGFMFRVHALYVYVLLFAAIVMLARRLRTAPACLRAPYITLLVVPLPLLSYHTLLLFFREQMPFNTTLVAGTLSNYILFWVIIVQKRAFRLIQVRDTAFESLTNLAAVVDEEGRIVMCNARMRDLIQSTTGINPVKADRITMNYLFHNRNVSLHSDDSGDILEINHDGVQRYYRMMQTAVTDRKGRVIGGFVEFADVSTERELIDQLYQLLNCDQLTGVSSRRYFFEQLDRWDRSADHLPICIINGDVNGLKQVNDTLGHEAGDELLRVIAAELNRNLPQDWTLARMGGDEFSILAPFTNDGQADAYMEQVGKGLARRRIGGTFQPEISLGYAIKRQPQEAIERIMEEADCRMYRRKPRGSRGVAREAYG